MEGIAKFTFSLWLNDVFNLSYTHHRWYYILSYKSNSPLNNGNNDDNREGFVREKELNGKEVITVMVSRIGNRVLEF